MTTPAVSTPSSTPTIKRSASDMGSDHEDHVDVPASSNRFASPLIDVYVGEHKFRYSVHSAFLSQSGELNTLHNLTAKKSKKGTNLNLPREDPKEIGRVIEFLYLDRLSLIAIEPITQIDELLSTWKTAVKFLVAGMKLQVVEKLDSLLLAEKIPALKFIKVADQMYENDIDTDLRLYFNKVAPAVVRKITDAERLHLDAMIEEGGSFAADLFTAYRRSFELPNKSIKSSAGVKSEGAGHMAQRSDGEAPDVMLTPMAALSGPADNRSRWEKENDIPALWAKTSEADKLLVSMVGAGKEWTAILTAVNQKTGEKRDMTTLLNRYNHLEANILRVADDDDVPHIDTSNVTTGANDSRCLQSDLLAAAQAEVEAEFKDGPEWPLVATRLIQKGGRGYEPIRLRYHCAALDASKQAPVASASTALVLATPKPAQTRTEVVGGVRVDNTKAINPRKRRRPTASASARSSVAPPVRRPAQARKKNSSSRQQTTLDDVSSNEDDSLMMGESNPRMLRTRSGRVIDRLGGEGDRIGSEESAATATMRGSSDATRDPSMVVGTSTRPEPIAIHDSDVEEL
ncbi:MAG: hypothetical protein Q9168_002644 [Polycauliona sp. 1 TL-2023]